MPKTIEQGFSNFLTSLSHSKAESTAATSHRASIEACLKSNFGLTRFFRSGSFGNGTSISTFSDVDFFAVIPSYNLKDNSATSLVAIRNALDTKFPSTDVRVSCPAVKVPFSKGVETCEVVPAFVYGTSPKGYAMYKIADCAGGWLLTSPDAHNAYVNAVNNRLSGMVKPLIRFIKAWKFYNNVSISSFYLEMRVAKWATTEPTIIYQADVRSLLKHLQAIKLAKLQDPQEISGYIVPTFSQVKLDDALSKLDSAVTRADKAYGSLDSEKFRYWDLVFNGHFPSYY